MNLVTLEAAAKRELLSNLSSATKCDKNHSCDNYEFGNT